MPTIEWRNVVPIETTLGKKCLCLWNSGLVSDNGRIICVGYLIPICHIATRLKTTNAFPLLKMSVVTGGGATHPRPHASVILDHKLFFLRLYFERTIMHNVYLILFFEIYMESIF